MYSRVVIVIIMLCCQIGVVGATTVEPITLPSQVADHTLVSTPVASTNDLAINKNVSAGKIANNVATTEQPLNLPHISIPTDSAANTNVPAATALNNVATADQVAIAQSLKIEKKSSQ